MLAVKLHKRKTPYLGKGSFLIPIRTWRSGHIHVRNWVKLLNRSNRGAPNDCIRFITLVKIPDDLPVFIGLDWSIKMIRRVEFTDLAQIDTDIKEKLDLVPPGKKGPLYMQNYIVPDPIPGAPMAEYPELILGQRMHSSFIKWTKDVRLLYGKATGSRHRHAQCGE
jgi:hypothetical protein